MRTSKIRNRNDSREELKEIRQATEIILLIGQNEIEKDARRLSQ